MTHEEAGILLMLHLWEGCGHCVGARMGQPGGERLWAPQVQQFHRTEQCLASDEKTQAAAAEAEGLPD